MTDEKAEPKSKPWQWPGEWMQDDAFWRDVASRTLSGLFVVGVGFVFAVAAGYVQQPDVIDSIAAVSIMGAMALGVLIFILSGFYQLGQLRRTVPILGIMMTILFVTSIVAFWASNWATTP